MNCNRVQILLSSFVDRELSADETRELRKHLFICPECDLEYQESLRLKNYLANIVPENLNFDPMDNLRSRLLAEEYSLLPASQTIVWIRRISLVAACIAIYLVTTSLLFPTSENNSSPKLATKRSNLLATPVSYDQNFSIDQSVSVYQASMVLP